MIEMTRTRAIRRERLQRRAVAMLIAATLVLTICTRPSNAQVPVAVSEAADRAEDAKQSAIKASNRNDHRGALDEMARCLKSLRRAESLATDSRLKGIVRDLLASEKNRTILFCFTGVDSSDISTGISKEWRQRIEKLDAPEEVANPQDLIPLDWKVNASYASLQQHLADYYIRNKDYSRANWHFAVAESYFDQYEQTAPGNVLSDPEQKRWRALNKKRLNDLLATKGITEGMYVQNSGVLQKWIGKVLTVDGTTIKVRITYKSSAASRGFEEGKDITLKRDEIKGLESMSIDAAVRGYK